jgi:hypothetical protein
MTAPIAGTVQREFLDYTNENGGKVRAHVVTDDTVGTVQEAYVGRSRDAVVGDVLVESGRPGDYTFMSARDFNDVYSADDDKDGVQDIAEEPESDDSNGFVADDHSAAEVRAYLNAKKAAGDTVEYDRVADAERSGKNRASAFPVV